MMFAWIDEEKNRIDEFVFLLLVFFAFAFWLDTYP
jgi:hypothetical protein